MSEFEKAKENGKKDIGQDVLTDLAEHDPNADKELQSAPPNLGERIRKALKNMKQAGPRPKKELAKDRTRSLVLLIGGSVGAVLLFLGVFSTPTLPPAQSTSGRAVPNLGTGVSQPLTPKGSVTPLLNADVAANAGNAEQVTPADIQGTSRRPPPDDITHPLETRSGARVNRVPSLPGRNPGEAGSLSNNGPDPLAAYRLNNNAGTPTYSYGGPAAAGAELSRTYAFGGAVPTLADTRTDAPVSAKSSIVFIRSSELAGPAGTRPAATAPFEEPSFLPPGTRLVARLETAAATGLKTPVVASIEYNYERDGMIMVLGGHEGFRRDSTGLR